MTKTLEEINTKAGELAREGTIDYTDHDGWRSTRSGYFISLPMVRELIKEAHKAGLSTRPDIKAIAVQIEDLSFEMPSKFEVEGKISVIHKSNALSALQIARKTCTFGDTFVQETNGIKPLCSNCNYEADEDEYLDWDFCPSCGREIVGEW